MKPGPAVAQQLGPMGVNMGKVISEVNQATSNFKKMKVPVELNIDEKTKEFTIQTSSPPTSELLKKELNIEKCTSNHNEEKVGNASIEDVIKITKIKYPNMLEKNFKNAVKSILGTCASIGILVESEEPNKLIKDVAEGKFDKEINEKSTETNPEKRQKLNEFFNGIKAAQDEKVAQDKKAAEEAEAKKAEKAGEGKEEKGKAVPSDSSAEGKSK